MSYRMSRRSILAGSCVTSALGAARSRSGESAPFECGTGVVDITPDGAKARDPLRAKAMVWRQGSEKAALVLCDIIGIPAELSADVRRLAAAETGIPLEHIAVAATHNHFAGGPKDLARPIASAVIAAHRALRPATIRAGAADLPGIAFNRRFLMKDGTVRFNPMHVDGYGSFDGGRPFLNPDIVRPVGPVDPQVGILAIHEPGAGRPSSALITFAQHVCTSDGGITADFPGFLEQGLRREWGDRFVSLFGPSPCGNVNHFDVTKPAPFSENGAECRRIGEALAATVFAGMPGLRTFEPSLAMRSRTIRVPLQEYDPADLAWAEAAKRDKLKDFPGTRYAQPGFLAGIRADKLCRLAKLRSQSSDYAVDVQAIRLSSSVAIVTLPGEMFVEFGLAIKRFSPFPITYVVHMANAIVGYIPNQKAWAEGGYEVVNSFFAPGGGEQIAQSAVTLLQELKTV